MESCNKEKGFTLAELLIVVAIIGILVAVSIPVFTAQLEKSRETVDIANLRDAKSAALAAYMADDLKEMLTGSDTVGYYGYYDTAKGTIVNSSSDLQPCGKGTETDTGTYAAGNNEYGYDSSVDYSKCYIMVAYDYLELETIKHTGDGSDQLYIGFFDPYSGWTSAIVNASNLLD